MPPSQPADTTDSPQGPQGPQPPGIPAPPTHHDAPTVAPDAPDNRRATLTPLEYLAWRRARGERLARAWRERQARYEQEHAQQRPLPAATPPDDDDDDPPPDAAG